MRFINTATKVPVGDKGDTINARDLIAHMNRNDARTNSDGDGIRASVRIERAIEKSKDMPFIILEDDDWKQRVCPAVSSPQPVQPGMPKYPLHPASALLPLIDDILNAPDERPVQEEMKTENGSTVSPS